MTDQEVLVALRDAGCDEELIRRFMALEDRGGKETVCAEQIRLLCGYRCGLMEALHACQKKVDCLDFLLYRLRDEKKSCCCKKEEK